MTCIEGLKVAAIHQTTYEGRGRVPRGVRVLPKPAANGFDPLRKLGPAFFAKRRLHISLGMVCIARLRMGVGAAPAGASWLSGQGARTPLRGLDA